MSTTIRSRIPVLISECLERGIDIEFDANPMGPILNYYCNKSGAGGHIHLDDLREGVYGANAICMEKAIVEAIEHCEEVRKSGAV
jgi:hypothetical protein